MLFASPEPLPRLQFRDDLWPHRDGGIRTLADRNGKCVICGESPTVKAHLFPRALMLDIRGLSPQLVAGSRHRDGVKLHQNGEWDEKLLCSRHENMLGAGDTYGVDFCRRWREVGISWPGEKAISVANPEPDKLTHFAYGIVWRHVHCKGGRDLKLDLGSYSRKMLRDMENFGSYRLQLLVGRNPLTVQGQRADIGIAPYRDRMGDLNVWHFTISGLDFYFKTDRRPFPSSWLPYLANGNDPVVIVQTAERDLHQVPKLFPILGRMLRTTWEGGYPTDLH